MLNGPDNTEDHFTPNKSKFLGFMCHFHFSRRKGFEEND